MAASPIGHKVRLSTDPRAASRHSAVTDPAQLPLASDSIDLVVLPHTLDLCADPRRLLREVERVLIPEGRLITVNFNPWSLWGLQRLLRRPFGREEVPWAGNFVGYVRLSDWLSLLGMEIERTEAGSAFDADPPQLAASAPTGQPNARADYQGALNGSR